MSRGFAVILLMLIPLFVSAGIETEEQFRSVIEEARLIHSSGRTDEALGAVSRLDAMAISLENLKRDLSDSEYTVFRSDYLLFKGLLLIDLDDEKEASEVLLEGIRLCENAYKKGGELFFLVQTALMKSHWMLLQKTSVLIRTGREIQDMTDLALEKDDSNFTARLISAQGLINAPPLFGGDPEKAAELLLSSENLAADDTDRFYLYLTLADARRKIKEWDDASRWCTLALSIYPDNRKALEMQDLISSKKK